MRKQFRAIRAANIAANNHRRIGVIGGLIALCGGCAGFPGKAEPSKPMHSKASQGKPTQSKRDKKEPVVDHLQVSVEKVAGFKKPEGDKDALLQLPHAGALRIGKHNPLLVVWEDMIQNMSETGRPAYVEYNSATREVTQIFQTALKQVNYIAPQPKGDYLEIGLLMSPSLYHLKTTRADYRQILHLAEESLQHKTPMLVTTNVPQILDIRRP